MSRSRTSGATRSAHLAKRLARGLFILWAGEIPFRYSEINALSAWIIRALLGRSGGICSVVAAAAAASVLARAAASAEGLILLAPILYISAVHFPLLTEARQSLPAQPIAARCWRRSALAQLTGHSLTLEPQMHEREHLVTASRGC